MIDAWTFISWHFTESYDDYTSRSMAERQLLDRVTKAFIDASGGGNKKEMR